MELPVGKNSWEELNVEEGRALTVFIVLVPGNWGLLVITPLLRNIIANLTIGWNITTNL